MLKELDNKKIAVIGLGYVGLPLAIEFSKKFKVLGFDIDEGRIGELNNGMDRTREVGLESLKSALDKSSGVELCFSSDASSLAECNIFIVTVPTPIDNFKTPDLLPLKKASEMIGRVLKREDIVIYESTVYPGCTEEDCVPILESVSGLTFNKDFFCGYSPERINPGDKINTLTNIKKVTSGSTPEIADIVDSLYRSIIVAGTHKASSIKVAEASKAIENAQRDLNISFVNELALICDRIGIDTTEVIEAASTKWNFLKFKPGLVGGHCIGVDPYYLAFKAESLGYHPQVISSGRRVNDLMGTFIVSKVLKLLIKKGTLSKKMRALILGFTFKENCPDFRNTKVVDIYTKFKDFDIEVDIYDPWVCREDVHKEYGIKLLNGLDETAYEIVILAVAHDEFLNLDFLKLKGENGVLFDIKSVVDRELADARL